MRLRASAAALMLSMTIPALLTEADIDLPVSAPCAFAQDAVTEVARQRYEEGVKAFDQGRYEDARAAFLQAYALKRHPAVLLNLGQSELRSGHYEDAGNHLQQFLRLHTSASEDQKKTAEKGITEAKKKTGFIILIVDANGASVNIDGTAVGQTPLLDPVFVKPGKHTVTATYQNKTSSTQVDAKLGSATAATLTLGTSGAPVAATPPPAAPDPTPPAAPAAPSPSPAASSLGPPPSAPAPSSPETSPLAPTASTEMGTTGTMEPDKGVTGTREPLFSWYKRKPIAWVGTGVAGVGLIGGIAFSIATAYVGAKTDKHAGQIQAELEKYGYSKGSVRPCAPADSGRPDYSFVTVDQKNMPTTVSFSQPCGVLREDVSDFNTNFALATVSWVLFGVGVVGTGVYAMIDWYPKKQQPTTGQVEGPRVSVAPLISPQIQGIGVTGSF